MTWWQAFWLGLTQGITEFIPVSSSGHLEIVQEIMGGRSAEFHYFLEFINFGTLLALIIFYRKRILKILCEIFIEHNYKFAFNMIITCIPAVILGLLLSDVIDSSPFFSSMTTIAVMMALIGLAMIFADKLPHLSPLKNETKLSPRRAFAIGLAQCVALVPGTSRSGSTILAGRMMGLKNRAAADYSFLVSIPLMCGVLIKTLLSSTSRTYIAQNLTSIFFANVIAFVVGSIVISWALKFLKRDDALKYFGWYRIIAATIIIIVELLK